MKPSDPVTMKVVCQPKLNWSHTIKGGDTIDPIAAPLLKIASPSARCFTGNHSATVFAAPGQLPASPNPRIKRNRLKLASPRANEWAIAAIDHTKIEIEKPRRVPTRSDRKSVVEG